MFEFYNNLSVLGKLIFYFSVLIIICSVFYQCYFCTLMPVKLTWNYPESNFSGNAAAAAGVEMFQNGRRAAAGRPRAGARSRERERRMVRDPSTHRRPSYLARTLSNNPRRSSLEAYRNSAAVREGNPTLILFYADWCSHCQSFKPQWNKLVKKLEGVVKTMSVNGDTNQKMMQKYNVDKFPTVILDNGRNKVEYDGDMSVEGLKQFVLTQKNNGRITRNIVV
jgi:thiol-disulfide isomerase/thioredoxin